MGIDIHVFVEYCNTPTFSGVLDDPACFLAAFQLNRDYCLFDALGNGRISQLTGDKTSLVARYPPRGIPPDVSLVVAREFFTLISDCDMPHPSYWPHENCISRTEADERIQHTGECVFALKQTVYFGTSPPRVWRVIPREHVFNASWLYRHEIQGALKQAAIAPDKISWDFRVVLTCLQQVEHDLGSKRVRLVFWFDK